MRRLLKFAGVGIVATLVHYIAALVTANVFFIHPEIANIIGFLLAFFVSFIGHWRWTFRDQGARFQHALPAFAMVAVTMFLFNASIFHLFLEYIPLRFEISLLFAQALVVLITFTASKYWAFMKPVKYGGSQILQ